MSVYIPGMEMPDRCFSCPLCNIEPNGESSCAKSLGPVIEYKEIDVETAIDTRPDWCPLVPVPEHGRLIDADALYEKFVRLESEAMGALQTTGIGSVDWIKWSAILTERTGYKFDIVDAPTIIPADKEGEG